MLRYKKAASFFYSLSSQILLLCVFSTFWQISSFQIIESIHPCKRFGNLSQCKCNADSGNVEIHCKSVKMEIHDSNQMQIDCNYGDIESFFEEFPDGVRLKPHMSKIVFNCSIGDNNSMRHVLRHMGVETLETFVFVGNQQFLHKTQFDGLKSVNNLLFGLFSFTILSNDLFENMPNVKLFAFVTNQTQLPKGILDPFINLQTIQLMGDHHSMEFPDGIFDRLKNLEIVEISKAKKLNFSKDIFASTISVTKLKLIQNEIIALPSGIFDNLINLESLILEDNTFNDLPHGLLKNTVRLKEITLSTNGKGNLRTLPSEFLANLSYLTKVELSASFEELTENFFYGSRNIASIDLSGNKLHSMPANLFRDQENLENLNLERNLLMTLSDNTFRSTTNLRELKLSHNQLTKITGATLYGLKSLRILQLDNNNLSFIANDTFCNTKNLKILNLNHNNLHTTSTRTFFNCLFSLRHLQSLDLSFNKIATITNEDFKFETFDYLKVILTGNQIETVNLSFFDLKFVKETTFHFDENPIKCDCKIADFIEYLKNQSNVKIETEHLLCKHPMEFQGKKLVEIDPCDLRCQNVDPALCPESCRCEYTSCSSYIIDCSDSKLVRLPTLPTLDSLKFDKIVLDLHNNYLTNLQRNDSKSYDKIISLNLTGNRLANIEASQLPANAEILDLRGNNLRSLPDDLFDSWSRNSSELKEVYLAHNPWPCDCESRSLLEFMYSEHNKVADKTSLLCINSTNQHQLLINFKVSQLCRDNKQLIIIIASVIAFCGLMAAVLIALYHRYKDEIKIWLYAHNMCLCFVSIEELERDKEYDGFVSYSHKDKEFVQKELMPFLELGPHPFKICDHERDWLVGDTIPEQIIKSVENSRRTLIILSDNYLESVWGRMEFQAAHQLAMKERQAKLIIILYGELKKTERIDDELKAYLNMNTYLEWGNPWFFKKLLYAMPHSKHSKTAGELSNPNENAFNMTNF